MVEGAAGKGANFRFLLPAVLLAKEGEAVVLASGESDFCVRLEVDSSRGVVIVEPAVETGEAEDRRESKDSTT